jgi:hypothetical protein
MAPAVSRKHGSICGYGNIIIIIIIITGRLAIGISRRWLIKYRLLQPYPRGWTLSRPLIGGWACSRVDLNTVEKTEILLLRVRTCPSCIQPVAVTNMEIPAHITILIIIIIIKITSWS